MGLVGIVCICGLYVMVNRYSWDSVNVWIVCHGIMGRVGIVCICGLCHGIMGRVGIVCICGLCVMA